MFRHADLEALACLSVRLLAVAVRGESLVPGVQAGPAGDRPGVARARGVGGPAVQGEDPSGACAEPETVTLRQGGFV